MQYKHTIHNNNEVPKKSLNTKSVTTLDLVPCSLCIKFCLPRNIGKKQSLSRIFAACTCNLHLLSHRVGVSATEILLGKTCRPCSFWESNIKYFLEEHAPRPPYFLCNAMTPWLYHLNIVCFSPVYLWLQMLAPSRPKVCCVPVIIMVRFTRPFFCVLHTVTNQKLKVEKPGNDFSFGHIPVSIAGWDIMFRVVPGRLATQR